MQKVAAEAVASMYPLVIGLCERSRKELQEMHVRFAAESSSEHIGRSHSSAHDLTLPTDRTDLL